MSVFFTYLNMGFEHISDIKGYDHILFIVTLCSLYRISQWKQIAVLVTAFTLGHSVTLALSAMKIIIADSYLIELLIPVTILLTALYNLFQKPGTHETNMNANYIMALSFGFIHGLGFSNFFNAILGDSMNIVYPLFAFNLGLEIGQLLIVVVFFVVYFLLLQIINSRNINWVNFISGIATGISAIMIIERI
jgi:hypothetical protein